MRSQQPQIRTAGYSAMTLPDTLEELKPYTVKAVTLLAVWFAACGAIRPCNAQELAGRRIPAPLHHHACAIHFRQHVRDRLVKGKCPLRGQRLPKRAEQRALAPAVAKESALARRRPPNLQAP